MSYTDKVVIVTGASSGIGAAIATMLCKEGASVVVVGRNEARLKKVSEQCAEERGKCLIIQADISNENDAKRIVKDTIDKFNKIDVLVNNAGILAFGTILDGSLLQAFDKIVAINLRGAMLLTTLTAPHLVKTKGNIVNISSIAGHDTVHPTYTAYATAKAGLNHFTRCSALELAASGVRVNAVSPGPVDTNIFENCGTTLEEQLSVFTPPLGRIASSEEIANLVLFVASEKAQAISGSVFVIDNGVTIRGLLSN